MNIISIEPTPSPNTMKINVSEELPAGQNRNYTKDDKDTAPDIIKQLLEIVGVKSLYHVMDFIALERNPKVDWEEILPKAREAFGEVPAEEVPQQEKSNNEEEAFGEINVKIQMFRGIPMQVKLHDGEEELRFGLPDRFMNAAMESSPASSNLVMERQWIEQSPRYGTMEEVGENVVEEVSAAYDQERLSNLVNEALNGEGPSEKEAKKERKKVTEEMLDDPDWKNRYAALDRMDPSEEDIPVLAKALDDEKPSIRRLATVYFGMIEDPIVLPYLYKALTDKTITVRRTAGDCLSDLGFKQAIPAMIKALKDKNKLVRWRAAMFLYEVGDESAVPALKEAQDDPEFEVKMQVKMALERIEGGEEAKGSVWHQMTQARKNT
ncbi:conserved virulence factor C family protein [Pseudalkalibacillus caeni]|uniref:Virulence factor n=1 Tax=Exobacillus caeni TaxID=2574798 RepID=A0A5R9F3C3_9BACL|nr:conserved virulence factor C family protein [Pseudalkalibacillus caeni]TLS37521.1 virulence factor [Pseudalkalibacillus caeni]